MNRKCANVGAENFQPNAIGSCKSFNQVHQGSDNSYTCTKTVRKYSNDMLIINRKVYDKKYVRNAEGPDYFGSAISRSLRSTTEN